MPSRPWTLGHTNPVWGHGLMIPALKWYGEENEKFRVLLKDVAGLRPASAV